MGTLADILNRYSVLIGMVVFVLIQYKYRKSDKATEVIGNYAVLEKQLKDQKNDLEQKLTAQADKHSKEMNVLHAQIGEKDAMIKMQQSLIQQQKETIENRNPDLEKILGEIRDFMENINTEIKENRLVSSANSKELHEQTDILKEGKTVVLEGKIKPL